ncbi:hypothetical protein WR25_20811 [Diploscapter pachys]|uniref:DNA topoisomerase 2 n=1 Tax=Diploscapter pachys TaxID=2018661 RepID=A0A2A2LDP1_9BILA|nr:hypothetical protein WR25_20811 [Diploscapter pachys]
MRRCCVDTVRSLRGLHQIRRFYLQKRALLNSIEAATCQAIPTTSKAAYATGVKTKAEKTVEYRRISGEEHALLRPDTYVGSIELVHDTPMWVYENGRVIKRNVTFSPALLKIFDEILVNAADNKFRDPKNMTEIRIKVDQESNVISIWNDGRGIAVEIHPDEGMYMPSLIFGQMYTSSHYDDQEIKCVGGRNGFGAKLCNIFSTRFEVETVDGKRGLKFRQKWMQNMQCAEEPVIEKTDEADHTCVTFQPDLGRFHMGGLTSDVCDLFFMRAVEVASTLPNVTVYYNDQFIQVEDFSSFMRLFFDTESGNQIYDVRFSPQWHIGVAPSNSGYLYNSFVNNIATRKGGTHVDYVMDKLIAILRPELKKQLAVDVRPQVIRDNLCLFVNCLIDNPSFSSQTKESLTTSPSKFGSSFDFKAKDILKWADSVGLIEQIVEQITADKQRAQRKKVRKPSKDDHLYDIAKLEDAVWAGSGKDGAKQCTLILTEGDSAKALAIAGLQVVGREKYGVFPLRGKLLNVSELTPGRILESAELKSVIRILGLQFDKKYETEEERNGLRYGRILLLTDQDDDGCHIRALVLNVIYRFWPRLIQSGFVTSLHTPLIKAKLGSTVLNFYSTKEFEVWQKKEEENADAYTVKYYKGLGTSTSAEAREYFRNLEERIIVYTGTSEADTEAMKVAFEREQTEERKKWLAVREGKQEEVEPAECSNSVSLKDFINGDLREYGIANMRRSIPNVMDGLKPSQRKILYTLMKQPESREVKVSQLAGLVAQTQAYHHGEVSLTSAIVKLAQNFVGSNNVPLLEGVGQFGTRHEGGEDAAAARYIYTKLSSLTRLIFPKSDDNLLEYCQEENLTVEPRWFCPIIPMVLVNGAMGLATGYSTRIPNHDPQKIIEILLQMIEDNGKTDGRASFNPYYEQFKGNILAESDRQFAFYGKAKILEGERKNSPIIKIGISELPVGVWTNRYKENVLRGLIENDKIKCFYEQHTQNDVKFILHANKSNLPSRLSTNENLLKWLKLRCITSMNMVLFDHNHSIHTYESPVEILQEHFAIRRKLYEERLRREVVENEAKFRKVDNQVRFIEFIVDGRLSLKKKNKVEIENELRNLGFEENPTKKLKGQAAGLSYLLNTTFEQMTEEELSKLRESRRQKEEEWKLAEGDDWKQRWTKELNTLQKSFKFKFYHVSNVSEPLSIEFGGLEAETKTEMANVNMSLDEIIQKNKKPRVGGRGGGFRNGAGKPRGGGGARRSTGGGAVRTPKAGAARKGFGRESTPPGKWRHDKFKELENGGSFKSGGAATLVSAAGGLAGNPNRKVRVNISNLATSVVTADLEELFEPYGFDTVTVHFNESGEPLGTGDVTLKRKDANKMLNDFKGVNLDGQLLKMVIVDGSTVAGGGISSRLQYTAKPQISRSIPRVNAVGGIRKKFAGGAGGGSAGGRRRNAGSGNPNRFLDRLAGEDESPRKGAGGRGGAGKGGAKKVKTAAQLDAELEAYMQAK